MAAAHLMSSSVISGLAIFNYLSQNELFTAISQQQNDYFSSVCTLVLFVTGIARSYLLKGGKIEEDAVHSIWSHMLQFKFVLTLLLTPLIYPLTFILVEEDEKTISDSLKCKI